MGGKGIGEYQYACFTYHFGGHIRQVETSDAEELNAFRKGFARIVALPRPRKDFIVSGWGRIEEDGIVVLIKDPAWGKELTGTRFIAVESPALAAKLLRLVRLEGQRKTAVTGRPNEASEGRLKQGH